MSAASDDSLALLFRELDAWADRETGPSEVVAYGEHPSQVVQLRHPADDAGRPLVLVLHGGFWRPKYTRDTTRALSVALARRGFRTANVEYRRLGKGAYRPMLDDVLAARRALAAAAGGRPVIAVGHSAGGHLALWLAAAGAVDGVVALGAVCDLADAAGERLGRGAVAELLGGEPGEVDGAYAEADPARRLPLGVPQVLVHGLLDDTVPIEHARRYAARAGEECRLVELPDAGHFDVIDPRSAAWAAVCAAVEAASRS